MSTRRVFQKVHIDKMAATQIDEDDDDKYLYGESGCKYIMYLEISSKD